MIQLSCSCGCLCGFALGLPLCILTHAWPYCMPCHSGGSVLALEGLWHVRLTLKVLLFWGCWLTGPRHCCTATDLACHAGLLVR